jgi:hypothetical protein
MNYDRSLAARWAQTPPGLLPRASRKPLTGARMLACTTMLGCTTIAAPRIEVAAGAAARAAIFFVAERVVS